MRPFGSSLAFILMAFTPLAAQEARLDFLHYTITGEKFGDKLGQAIAGLNDVDGDKCPDFAVGVPQYCAEEDCRGKVVIYSGKTGTVIRSWGNVEKWTQYGQILANGGDLDGDAIDDVLAGTPYFVEQRSSRTGERLGVVYPGGEALLNLGDVDKDGVPDFVVGNTRPQDSWKRGRIVAYSGKALGVLWTRQSEREQDGFGYAMAAMGDVDGDAVPDLAAAAPGTALEETPGGIVYILSARDGTTVRTDHSHAAGDFFGSRLVSVRDVNGDGVNELIVAIPGFPVRGVPGAGAVVLYDATQMTPLWRQTGHDFDRSSFGSWFGGDSFGGHMANAGRVDADAFEDVAVLSVRAGLAGTHWSRVTLCSGSTGSILAAYETEKNETQFGWTLSRLGDIDGDGRSEFLIGAPEYFEEEDPRPDGTWLFNLGRVYVVSYDPESPVFLRGDTDLDGDMDITDSIALLLHLYQGGAAGCEEALDIDRNHAINLTDAVIILLYLFQAGMAPQPPFPDCSRFEAFSPRLSCEKSSCR